MKDLEKAVLLITDLVKEIVILFTMLIVTHNYLINFAKYDMNECNQHEDRNLNNNAPSKNPDPNKAQGIKAQGIKEYIEDTVNETIKHFMNKMKCIVLNTNEVQNSVDIDKIISLPFFVVYLVLLYLFIYRIKPNKKISWKYIVKDLRNKIMFVLLFPMLFIIILPFLYVITKLWFSIFTTGTKYSITMKFSSIFLMILLGLFVFLPIWLSLVQVLFYLIMYGNVSYLKSPDIVDVYDNLMLFLVLSVISFFGFYKILFFTFKSSFLFMFNSSDIMNQLKIKQSGTIYLFLLMILSIIILMNLKDLFSYNLFIFGVVIFVIFIFLIARNIYINRYRV